MTHCVIDQFPLCSSGLLLPSLRISWTQRGEILRGAPGRGRLLVILYFFISPTFDLFSLSGLPIGDGLIPVFCNRVPGVLGQLFGLGHGGQVAA